MSTNYSFLQDEVRNGFYVPAIVKQCWAMELDILSHIDSLCRKYNIKYYAEYGTLLGAVRHAGFIPWDDDLDIGMFRTDLERFLSVSNELPDGYMVHCYKNRPDYDQFIYNVVNTSHINLDPAFLQNSNGMPYICGVDIFVMDNVSDDEVEEKDRCTLANYIIQIADSIFAGTNSKAVAEIVYEIEQLTGDIIPQILLEQPGVQNVPLRIRLYEIAEKLFAKFNNINTSQICQIMPWGLNGVRHYPREYYDELIRIPFENTTIPVPTRYDSMLVNRYGDYMRLIKDQGAHDYPCFAQQQDSLKKQIVDNMGIEAYNSVFPTYNYSKNLDEKYRDNITNSFDSSDTIVFLPFSGKYWNTMSAEYEKEAENSNSTVYVVPIPYYYRDFASGELIDEQYDIDLYPENIELYDWTTFDIKSMNPSKIYIQYPYDEYNPVTSVHPDFYSSALKNYTKELVYIPWFNTGDFDASEERSYQNMNHYCLMPAIVNASKIILYSEKSKKLYVQKLSEWSQDSSSIWSDKICVSSPVHSMKSINRPPILMYYIGLGQLIENGHKEILKIKRTLTAIRNRTDNIILYIKVDSTFEDTLAKCNIELYNDFMNIISPIMDDPEWMYDNTDYNDYAVNYCHAFYGDSGHLANMFIASNKPCMIQNITI